MMLTSCVASLIFLVFVVFVAAGAGLIILVGVMRRSLLCVLLNHFTLFRRVLGYMQKTCLFRNSQRITRMACIVSLAFSSAYLTGVGWRSGFTSLFIPVRTGTVVFCLLIIFVRCSSFVDCLCNFHTLEHLTCLLVGHSFKTPSLYVGFVFPTSWGRREGESSSVLQGTFS